MASSPSTDLRENSSSVAASPAKHSRPQDDIMKTPVRITGKKSRSCTLRYVGSDPSSPALSSPASLAASPAHAASAAAIAAASPAGRSLAASPTIDYADKVDPVTKPTNYRFVFDPRLGLAKAFDLDGDFAKKSTDRKEVDSFMQFFFESLEFPDGVDRDYWWQSEVTVLEYTPPSILKRPTMKKPACDADGDAVEEEAEDGDDESEGHVAKRPAAKTLKSSEYQLEYSKVYHQVRTKALKAGAKPEAAKVKAQKAARKHAAPFKWK